MRTNASILGTRLCHKAAATNARPPSLLRKHSSVPPKTKTFHTSREAVKQRCYDEKAVKAVGTPSSNSTSQAPASSNAAHSESVDTTKAPLNIQVGDRSQIHLWSPATAAQVPTTSIQQPPIQPGADPQTAGETSEIAWPKDAAQISENGQQGHVVNAQAHQEYSSVVFFSKATIVVQAANTLYLWFMIFCTAANTMVAVFSAAVKSAPQTAQVVLLKGLVALTVLLGAVQLSKFAFANYSQGHSALGCFVEVLQGPLKSLFAVDLWGMQPDHEEQPVPAGQFFCTGVVSSGISVYLTIKVLELLLGCPAFEVLGSFLSKYARCGCVVGMFLFWFNLLENRGSCVANRINRIVQNYKNQNIQGSSP